MYTGCMSKLPDRKGILLVLPELVARLFSGRPAAERAQVTQAHMSGSLFTPRNVIIAVLGLLYVIWPLDLLPDIMPVIGWLDDIGVLALLVAMVVQACRKEPEEGAPPRPERDEPIDVTHGRPKD